MITDITIEVEAHTDRYVDAAREDKRLKEMHVLVGAFTDGNDCIPVQLEVKEYIPEAGMPNKLYVTVTMKNEAGVTPRGSTASSASVSIRSRPASIINLADLIANVKDESGGLVKYLPDQMLTEKQKQAKEKALLMMLIAVFCELNYPMDYCYPTELVMRLISPSNG